MPKSINSGPLQPRATTLRITLAEEVVQRARRAEAGRREGEPPIAPNLAQRQRIMNLAAFPLRERVGQLFSDALQALAAAGRRRRRQDAEIATPKLHLDDLRRQAGLSSGCSLPRTASGAAPARLNSPHGADRLRRRRLGMTTRSGPRSPQGSPAGGRPG